MSKIRDLLYMSYDNKLKRVISYGMEFNEFIRSLTSKPENVLVLQGYYGTKFDFTTSCEYCSREDLEEFIQEDVYSYGNFSWIDFEREEALKELEPYEVAELLYLGKLWKPVNETYFKKLNNRFAYMAHDDGWVNHTYYNKIRDFKEVISGVIRDKLYRIYDFKTEEIKEHILDKIIQLCIEGCAIDLMRLEKGEGDSLSVPIFILGEYTDMDAVYTICREQEIAVDFELKYELGLWNLVRLE